jgi:hypothetical protein
MPRARITWEELRKNQLHSHMWVDLLTILFNDLTNPAVALRARMTNFFQNWFTTPISAIGNDYLLMHKQYSTVRATTQPVPFHVVVVHVYGTGTYVA